MMQIKEGVLLDCQTSFDDYNEFLTNFTSQFEALAAGRSLVVRKKAAGPDFFGASSLMANGGIATLRDPPAGESPKQIEETGKRMNGAAIQQTSWKMR